MLSNISEDLINNDETLKKFFFNYQKESNPDVKQL